jgi:hypothetical protein
MSATPEQSLEQAAPALRLPPDVARRTSEKYLEAYSQLTGRKLDV